MDTPTLYAPEILEMFQAAKNCIIKLGFTKFRENQSPQKRTLMFALTNQGQSTDETWNTFPIIIDVSVGLISVKIIFTYRNAPYKFEQNSELFFRVFEFLTRANRGLQLGCFTYKSNFQVVFDIKTNYQLVEKKGWEELVNNSLSVAISTYKSYGFGIVAIIENQSFPDLNSLVLKCEERQKVSRSTKVEEKKKEPPEEQHLSESSEDESLYSDSEEDSFDFEYEKEFIEKILSNPEISQHFIWNIRIEDYKSEIVYTGKEPNFSEVLLNASNKREIIRMTLGKLLDLYRKDIVFLNFPKELVVYQEGEVFFCPVKLKRFVYYPEKPKDPQAQEKRYLMRMTKEINYALMSVLSRKHHNIFGCSSVDLISLSAFKHPDITNEDLLIGHGGYGYVYINEAFGMKVAIKIPRKVKGDLEKANKRIYKELNISKYLQHQNCSRALGLVEHKKGQYGLVQEYYENKSLNEYMKKVGLSEYKKLEILIEIAKGLEFIHSKGICHFDIKPHNVFLDSNLVAKIADFGLSEYIEKDKKMKTGFTLIYCSPEQIKGDSPSRYSDIWSFGMTMYCVLCEKSPFFHLIKKQKKLEKRAFYNEIKNNEQRPFFSEEFQAQKPNLVEVMKGCWVKSPVNRTELRTIIDELYKELKKLE